MDLSKISDEVLLARTKKLAQTERKITHIILCHINEVEDRKLYLKLDCVNMYHYLTKHLGYSEDQAYPRMNAAKVLKQVPQIAEKIESGAINLTQLTRVQKCLRENKDKSQTEKELAEQVLEKIENLNGFETQKVLAVEFNQPIEVAEKVKPQRDGSIRLEMMVTEEEFEILKQARELSSHAIPNGNWATLYVHLAQKQVAKVMGKSEKVANLGSKENNFDASRDNASNSQFQQAGLVVESSNATLKLSHEKSQCDSEQNTTQSFWVARKRKPVKITTKRFLLKKANNCCEYIDAQTGHRCTSKFQLQIDHRQPWALGGSDDILNLRVLCRTHNLSEAKKFGLGFKRL